jgi:hypothetical protein
MPFPRMLYIYEWYVEHLLTAFSIIQQVGPEGNIGFIGFTELEYEVADGRSARTYEIVIALADKIFGDHSDISNKL